MVNKSVEELDEDIQKIIETLKNFQGDDKRREELERMQYYMEELKYYRELRDTFVQALFHLQKPKKNNPFFIHFG